MHRDQQTVLLASIINCPLATKPKSNTPPPNTHIKTHNRPSSMHQSALSQEQVTDKKSI